MSLRRGASCFELAIERGIDAASVESSRLWRNARYAELLRAGVDLIAVDTAHGHSKNVLDVIGQIRRRYPDLDLAGGNVAT